MSVSNPKQPKAQSNVEEERAERREAIKELYDYAISRLDTERERFNQVDEKATKLADVFIYIIGGLLFFVNLVEKNLPTLSMFDWILAGITVLTLFTSFYGWFLCIRVPKLRHFAEPPFDITVVKFFEQHRVSDVRYAWAKEFVKAYEKNVGITNDKQLGLHAATNIMSAVVGALVLLCFLYVIKLLT